MAAFLQPTPWPTSSISRAPTQSCPRRRRRQAISAKTKKPSQSAGEKQRKTPATADLVSQLKSKLNGMNRGLDIDADEEFLTPEEADIEDLVAVLESRNPTEAPTQSPLLVGSWALLYSSSSITRFFGGVTGLQRLLPDGGVGEIIQRIDAEDGTADMREMLTFELPFVGEIQREAITEGKLRKNSDVRLLWEAERVRVGRFSWFADGWKTLRAFQICDITYLDKQLRITRGTTGSVNVFERVER